MKRRILSVLAVAIGLASCSTAYRQGQTPDDVYYSPAKEKTEAYASANDNRQYNRYQRNNNDYEDYTSSSEYSQWYNDLVIKGQLADYSAVRGCMVIKPYGYTLWEKIIFCLT